MISGMTFDTSANSSFSRQLPGFQFAIDSTSLGEFKTCPRKYFYSIVAGWGPRGESPHLTFGILLHKAREDYDKARLRGDSHDEALDASLDSALKATWNKELGRPWLSGHNLKNRLTLIQTLVWYLDDKGRDDSLETMVMANGQPAVELSFRFDSGLKCETTGEAILLCGHLDRIAYLNDVPYITDIKTSGSDVSARWAQQFTPGNQFSLYALAGRVAFGLEIKDLIVDGVQVGVGFSRFQRHVIRRTEDQLSEWLHDTSIVVGHMEDCAVDCYWPQNDKACGNYGGCPFQSVCSKSPSSREAWLKSDFDRRVWDPLQVRGEV